MAWARKNTGGGRGVENAICVMYAGLGPDAGRAANNTTVEHFADIEACFEHLLGTRVNVKTDTVESSGQSIS